MFKEDAVKFFGSKSNVAKAAGVERSAVSQWGRLVPEKNASRLQSASGGVLQYDPEIYDRHAKGKKCEVLNDENHTSH